MSDSLRMIFREADLDTLLAEFYDGAFNESIWQRRDRNIPSASRYRAQSNAII